MCYNPCCTGDDKSLSALGLSPSLQKVANSGALDAKGGVGANIFGGLQVAQSVGSAVSGNYDAQNNDLFPNQFTLIIDTTANSGAITKFPLFDNLGVFKKANVAAQASALSGTVFGLTGADATKIYFEDETNLLGYDNLLNTLCNGGFLIEAFMAYVVNNGEPKPIDLNMSIVRSDVYGETQTLARFNTMNSITNSQETQSIVALDRTTRHVPGMGALIIASLPAGKKIRMQFVTPGKVK